MREQGNNAVFVPVQPILTLIRPGQPTFLRPVQPKPSVYRPHLSNSTRHSIPAELPALSNRRHLAISCPDSQSQKQEYPVSAH